MEWRTSWRRRWIVSSGSWNVLTGFLTKNFTPLVTKHFKPQVKTVLLTQNIMPLVKTGLTHLVTRKGQLHMMQTPLVLTFPLMETHLVTMKGLRLFAQAANCDLGFDGAAADPGETSASAQDLANHRGVLGGG